MYTIGWFFVWFLELLLGTFTSFSQVSETYPLSDKLNEISGLEVLNDSTLIALNDGGNKAEIYLLSLEGEIVRTVNILDTKNHDWEDIARDETHIYIGDIGNNLNQRQNLSVLKVDINELLQKDEVSAEKITFSYTEQSAFPPEQSAMFFDAEGMIVHNDSIWVFTKDRSQPFQGLSHVYKFPTEPGDYKVKASHRLKVATDGWWKDGVTAVDFYNNLFYVLTYNRYIACSFKNGEFTLVKEYIFDDMSQRESIVVLNEDAIFVADEKNPIAGDVQMYKIQP